jgi:hypothetical protein
MNFEGSLIVRNPSMHAPLAEPEPMTLEELVKALAYEALMAAVFAITVATIVMLIL